MENGWDEDLIARLRDLSADAGQPPPPGAVNLPFGSFDPAALYAAGGRLALGGGLLRLRGLIEADKSFRSALELLGTLRDPSLTGRIRPTQDWFLPSSTEGGRDLIAAENQWIWAAELVDRPNEATGEVSVRIVEPELGTVFGELPLDDLMVRIIVQELVWMMRPKLFERRTLEGAIPPVGQRVTDADAVADKVDGLFPADVAVGSDWILTFGSYRFQSLYLLRYERPELDFDERFERARAETGGTWRSTER